MATLHCRLSIIFIRPFHVNKTFFRFGMQNEAWVIHNDANLVRLLFITCHIYTKGLQAETIHNLNIT